MITENIKIASHVKHEQTALGASNEEANLNRVRELLFGEQVKILEQRIAGLESLMRKELDTKTDRLVLAAMLTEMAHQLTDKARH